MIGKTITTLAAFAAIASGVAATAQPKLADSERAEFRSRVQEYRGYVVPICDPDTVGAYQSFNRVRDDAFVRSLAGSELWKVYQQAVVEKQTRDDGIVYHCFGPPPPPPAPGQTLPSARQRAITGAQQQIQARAERLLDVAKRLPAVFDAGDVAFSRLIALRDTLLSRKAL